MTPKEALAVFEPDIDLADQHIRVLSMKIEMLTDIIRDCRKEFQRLVPRISPNDLDQVLQGRIRAVLYGQGGENDA